MSDTLDNRLSELQNSLHTRHIWYRVLFILVCITLFFTVYALIIPAITMEADPVCGMENHIHSEECYDESGSLTCTLEEHEHDMLCYVLPKDEEPNYICGFSDEHIHTEECYTPDGELSCAINEHTHTDECISESDSDENGDADIEVDADMNAVDEHDKDTDVESDNESDDKPDTERDKSSDTAAENNPDNGTDVESDNESEDKPDIDTDKSSDTNAENDPDNSTESKPDEDNDKQTGNAVKASGRMAVSASHRSPGGDFYSSDLSEFITDVELTDIYGNVIDLNSRDAVVNVGERYRLSLHFDENPDTNHLRQFEYDSDGFLVYDLDAIGLIFDQAHSVGGDITIIRDGTQKVVGSYIFELDPETGRHLAKVHFYDVDDKGEPTPGNNFIDLVQDAGFGMEVAVTVDSDSNDEEFNMNLGASWNVTLKKNDDVSLTVDKVESASGVSYEERYPRYDEATHSILYKVIVKCTQGAVDHIQYSDSGVVKVLDVEYNLTDQDYSNYYDFVITDLQDNLITTGNSFDCLSSASGPISNGEGYIIYYRMKIDPPGRSDILDQTAALYFTVDNTITVDYQNPSDRSEPCAPLESSTSTKASVINLAKEGVATGGTDASGNKIISWYIIAGDKNDSLSTPFVVNDVIGAGHSFYPDNPPTWELVDSNNTVKESGVFTAADFSADGNTLTFSLPHDTDYRFRVRYYTVTDNDNGGTYSNTASVPERNWSTTYSLNVAGGIGSMTKEVTDSDNDYIYFTITANIPHSVNPFLFYFTDMLYSVSQSNKIENAAEDVSVQVEYYDEYGTRVVKNISEYNTDGRYSTTDDEVRFFIVKSDERTPDKLYSWQMLFFKGETEQIHTSRSRWYFNDYDSVLTVSYKIPKNAEAFLSNRTSSTLREQLAAGNRITNQVWFDQTYNATVVYTEPLPVTKRGAVQSYSDGTLLYEVAFTNDVIPIGETNPQNYLPLCENFVNAVFIDNFDEALEYVPDSLMAFVYRRSENTQYCYYGSHFGINENSVGQSPNIEAVFRYSGPVPSGSTINAAWDNFIYEPHSDSGTEDIFGHLYRAWKVNSNVHPGMTLEELANILKNSRNENDTAVVFLYQLRVKDEHKLDAHIELQNDAGVKWDQPFGTYVSPPAIFDIDYDPSLVNKEMDYQDGDIVSYVITVNPHGLDLTPDPTMIVRDEMCEFLSPYMASLKVYQGTPGTPDPVWDFEIDPNALYDSENNIISMTLPDNVPLRITYNCLILSAQEGQSVLLDNSVTINGTPKSVNVNHASITITASSSTGIGTNHYMYLQKQDNQTHPLNDAVFALYGNKEIYSGTAPAGVAQEITYEGVTLYYYSSHTTQDDSDNVYLHGVFRLDETNDHLESNGLFALVELEAPYGYEINPIPMYFYWLDTPEDAVEGVEVFRHEKDYEFVDYPVTFIIPETGSSGGLICLVLAASCFAVSAVISFAKLRRKRYGEKV